MLLGGMGNLMTQYRSQLGLAGQHTEHAGIHQHCAIREGMGVEVVVGHKIELKRILPRRSTAEFCHIIRGHQLRSDSLYIALSFRIRDQFVPGSANGNLPIGVDFGSMFGPQYGLSARSRQDFKPGRVDRPIPVSLSFVERWTSLDSTACLMVFQYDARLRPPGWFARPRESYPYNCSRLVPERRSILDNGSSLHPHVVVERAPVMLVARNW